MANEFTSSTSDIGTGEDGLGQDGLKAKAQETISKVQDRAGEKIESSITEQKTRAADKLSGVAQSLLTSSQQVREGGNEDVSRYIERAADQVDRLASYLQRADVTEVVDQVEGFARRQPAAFMASAFAVGFLASRFLKSSRGNVGYGTNDFGDSGRSYGFGSGGELDTPRSGYGTSGGRNESWRKTGYAASESNFDGPAVGGSGFGDSGVRDAGVSTTRDMVDDLDRGA